MSALSITPTFDAPRRTLRPVLVLAPVRVSPRPVSAPTRPVVPAALAVPAPRVRLSARGRGVLLVALLTLVLAAMTVLGGKAIASFDAAPGDAVRVVEVRPGDTLYGIAGDLAGPGEVREMVARIQQLNSLDQAGLVAGKSIAVPTR